MICRTFCLLVMMHLFTKGTTFSNSNTRAHPSTVRHDFIQERGISQKSPVSEKERLKEYLFQSIQRTRTSLFKDKELYRKNNADLIYEIQMIAKHLNFFFSFNFSSNSYGGTESLNLLLDGKWEVFYSTNSGYSVGRVGSFVGNKVDQMIETSMKKYNNTVYFCNGLIKFTINSKFEPISYDDYQYQIQRFAYLNDEKLDEKVESIKIENFLPWKVTFSDFIVKIGCLTLFEGHWPQNKLIGIWKLIYIDEDIRVFYSRNYQRPDYSINDNLYVLKRVPSDA